MRAKKSIETHASLGRSEPQVQNIPRCTAWPWKKNFQANTINGANGEFVVDLNNTAPADGRLILSAPELAEELDWTVRLLEMVADDFEELGQPQKASSVRTHADKARRRLSAARGPG